MSVTKRAGLCKEEWSDKLIANAMRLVCVRERAFEFEIFLPLRPVDRYVSTLMIHATLTPFEAKLIVFRRRTHPRFP